MSSRLFQEIRERRGLAYSVYSYTTQYADSGVFGVYAPGEDVARMRVRMKDAVQHDLFDLTPERCRPAINLTGF
jgi:hypothetical protein